MNLRIILVFLFVASLPSFPAFASQPAGLAANLINDHMTGLPATGGECLTSTLEWVERVEPRVLEPGDTLRLELAIAPFRSGSTLVGLDTVDGYGLFQIEFSDGLVNGIPYRRSDWNDVVVEIRAATQDYLITVNGVRGGPFPHAELCTSGCYSMQTLRIMGFSNDVGSAAWFDSIVVTRESAGGDELLLEMTFDWCGPRPRVRGGVTLIVDPPQPLFHRGRNDGR